VAIIAQAEPEVIALLMNEDDVTLQMFDVNGMMTLHLAVDMETDVDLVKDLISEYPLACVARSGDGSTPLHIAITKQRPLTLLKAKSWTIEVAFLCMLQ
jgi:hypothetical protein